MKLEGLTDEQMIEIFRARERLETYRNKVQPYSLSVTANVEREVESEERVVEHIHRHINYNSDVSMKQWGRIDSIAGEVKYLRDKLEDASKKKTNQGEY